MAKTNGVGMWRAWAQILVLGVASAVAIGEESGEADGWTREGAGLYLIGQAIGSDTVYYGDDEDEVDSFSAYGVGLGATQGHLGLNMELLWGSTSDLWNGRNEYDADLWFWNVNMEWNILKGRLTPVVTGGIGLVGMEGQNSNGSPYDETTFSYNLGIGARWDVTDHIALKILYRSTWAEFDFADQANQFDGIQASIAYVFR